MNVIAGEKITDEQFNVAIRVKKCRHWKVGGICSRDFSYCKDCNKKEKTIIQDKEEINFLKKDITILHQDIWSLKQRNHEHAEKNGIIRKERNEFKKIIEKQKQKIEEQAYKIEDLRNLIKDLERENKVFKLKIERFNI
jgi:chromosome segregation ATPase